MSRQQKKKESIIFEKDTPINKKNKISGIDERSNIPIFLADAVFLQTSHGQKSKKHDAAMTPQ